MPDLMKVINFKGTGSLTHPLSVSYGLNFTIEFWVKPHSMTQPNLSSFLMRGNGNASNGILIYNNKITYRSGESNGGGVNLDDFIASNYPVGEWTHVALVISNGKSFEFYRNFVKVNSGQVANNSTSVSSTLSIGDWSANYGAIFNGSLALLRLWNINLSIETIKKNSKKLLADANLVYQLDAEKFTETVYGAVDRLYDLTIPIDKRILIKNQTTNQNYSLSEKTLISLPNASNETIISYGIESGKEIRLDEGFDKINYVNESFVNGATGKITNQKVEKTLNKILGLKEV